MSRLTLKRLRHLHRRGKTLGRAELVRIAPVRVPVHRDNHLVLLGERHHPLRDRQIRGGGDDAGAERPGHLEAAIDLLVGHVGVEAVVVGVDRNAGGVELLLDRRGNDRSASRSARREDPAAPSAAPAVPRASRPHRARRPGPRRGSTCGANSSHSVRPHSVIALMTTSTMSAASPGRGRSRKL